MDLFQFQVAVFIDYFVTLLTKWKFDTLNKCIFWKCFQFNSMLSILLDVCKYIKDKNADSLFDNILVGAVLPII